MEGYRTYIVALIGAALGIVNNLKPGLLPVFDEATINAFLAVVMPLAMLALRKVTKTPPAI